MLRYFDNIFFVWTRGKDKVGEFLERLNSFHPNLKFTLERSEQKINFLDITVQLSNNKFVTDLYCKPTDCHQYLHYNSCLPDHMKKSSVYSQGLHIKRLCSEDTALAKHLKDLKPWFCGRGYPENMVTGQLARVKYRNREYLLRTNDYISKKTGVPLVVTYHPQLNVLNKIIRRNLKHLYADQLARSVFTPAPFISFRTAQNLRSHLVRSKLYPLKRTTGSYKCNTPRCQVGKNVKECYEFSSHGTKETFKISHCFDSNSKCLIYLMSCKVCGKQYVGSTTERFRFQWNNYKSFQRKAERGENCMQKYFHGHLLIEGHNGLINDVKIVFIDKTDPSDPTRREEFWRNKLKTLAPYGLNVEE